MPTRRQFIAGGGALLAAGLLGEDRRALAVAPPKRAGSHGRIVRVASERLVRGERPDPEVAARMLEAGVRELTGHKSAADAWSSLVSAKDLVGIKINCLGKPKMSTTPEVVAAVVAGLRSAGVPDDRIVVFDLFGSHMTMSRFRLSDRDGAVRYVHNKQWGYEAEWRTHPSGKVKLTNILLKADKIISVPVVKNHAQSGVTCALKNMAFGTIINPSAHHRGFCDPGIANIYNLAPIREKVALIVCDGAFMQYDGGPQFSPAARLPWGQLLLTHDPVALDKLAWQEIDARRKSKGLPLLGRRGGKPIHVGTAAGLGLGTDDPSRIKVVDRAFR